MGNMEQAEFAKPWLAHYDPEVRPEIDYEIRPMDWFLDRTAKTWPRRKAIIHRNWSVNWAGLGRLTEVCAANLRKMGVEKGDRVALMLPNLPQTIIAYWAIMRAGGVVVMTNPLYMESELLHQLGDSGARVLITLDLLWPRIQPLLDRVPVEKCVITSIADGLRFPLSTLFTFKTRRGGRAPEAPFDGKKVRSWKSLLEGKEGYTCRDIDPEEDTAILQYTGGTTGIAKGCVLTHANLAVNMQQCHAMLHTLGREREVFLGILPYFHIYGLTTCINFPTVMGATQIPFPRFSPQDVLVAAHKHKPTVFPGAPSLYISLLQQKEVARYDLSSIKYCISGSAPMPVEYLERFEEVTGASIVEGYGLTEASPVTHLNPLRGKRKPGSIGIPFPDTQARVVDMEVGGLDVEQGRMGELILKGPQVMKGYFNRPDETANALRNGWLYTGDIARMDEDGYFHIVDRKKDLIISGGFNIYPREIDEVLHSHPSVREAVAVGVPHKTRGEVVKAFLVVKEGAELSRAEIVSWCRRKLAAYKVPRQVEFRDELPKTLVGKVLRRALRAEEEAKGG